MGTFDDARRFDLFISYAHVDDGGDDPARVTALVAEIRAEYRRVTCETLADFFDVEAIRAMHDWESRILHGLRQSKMMVAVLSPAYFRSEYCRKEWEYYIETELAHAFPGDGIAPIYVLKHPDFETGAVAEGLEHWVGDLKKRQYVDWLDYWPHGALALERDDARRKIEGLTGDIVERLGRAAILAVNHHVPRPSRHFVGRRDELHRLQRMMIDGNIGAISAVHGIGGIGKSTLAFAYAWGYGFQYPGGRFLIEAAGQRDLAGGLIALAEPKGVALTDAERQQPEVALARVKKAFEDGPPALIVLDNLEDPALLGPRSLERFLPKGNHIHLLVTTRTLPEGMDRVACLPLDSLSTREGQALLDQYHPIAADDWKASLEIVNRLAGHALALEVVGVFLRMKQGTVSYRDFAATLERDGIAMIDDRVAPTIPRGEKWHEVSCLAQLLEPTLASLRPEEIRAVEYAAMLPPDAVPLAWLRDLVRTDFLDLPTTGIDYAISDLFRTLERLRLVVTPPNPVGVDAPPPAETRLARMHRLVQAVVRRRAGPEQENERREVVERYASQRGEWINAHWGQPGLAWELPTLRDLTFQMIDRGDERCVTLGNLISTPLQHIGLVLHTKSIWHKSNELLMQRYEAEPENASHAQRLMLSYSQSGDLARATGDVAGALEFFEAGLVIARRLSAAKYGNDSLDRNLLALYDRLADLTSFLGDKVGARRYVEDGLIIANRLAKDPHYAHSLSISYRRLGNLTLEAGDSAEARQFFEKGMEVARRAVEAAETGPMMLVFAHTLFDCYGELGNLALSTGDAAGARHYFNCGLDIAKILANAAPEHAGYARVHWVAYWNLASLPEEPGAEPSQTWFRRVWEILADMQNREIHLSAVDEGIFDLLKKNYGFHL